MNKKPVINDRSNFISKKGSVNENPSLSRGNSIKKMKTLHPKSNQASQSKIAAKKNIQQTLNHLATDCHDELMQ